MPSSALPTTADLLRVNRVEGAHRVALRAAVSIALPLLACILSGHTAWAPFASFGAFTSLYGRSSSRLVRLQMQAVAGLAMTAAVVCGVLVRLGGGGGWWQVFVAALVAAAGEVLARACHFHPPGPLFLVFAFGSISSVPHHADELLPAVLVAAAAAVLGMLVGVAGIVRDPGGVRGALAGGDGLRPRLVLTVKPAWMALGVVVSGALAVMLHIGHPYWAMVSAVAPLSAPHVTHQITRAVQRTIGTTAGLATAWLALSLHLAPAWAVLLIALLQFATELLIGVNYALALLMITPMALLMGQLGHPRPVGALLVDRGVETVLGSTVGMAVILAGHLAGRRRPASAAPARPGA